MERSLQPDRSRRPERLGIGPTGRRGFVVATSLGILSLYGLWSVYGAAPGLRLSGEPDGEAAGGSHDGHGAVSGDLDAFRADAEAFIARYRLADGSVQPPSPVAAAQPAGGMSMDGHGGHDGQATVEVPTLPPAHREPEQAAADVYLLVQQWLFEPAVLRLSAGVLYRFRMLALDVSHGASLQLGLGSRIVRLRPGVPSELLVRFERPGEVLLYCTVYCGLGHDQMHGRIIVA